jgi:hypothetical protein
MDFEWIKGVNCISKQAQEGWLSLWWFWNRKLEHTNRGRRELLACRRRTPGGAIYRVSRPAWGGSGPPGSVLSPSTIISPLWLLCPRAPLVAPPKRSHPLLCLHYWSFHLMHLLWVMSMLPCFTCHHEFPAKQCLLPTHACPLHVVLMKVVWRASNDASWCMHDLFN